jgi:hypothetical protein
MNDRGGERSRLRVSVIMEPFSGEPFALGLEDQDVLHRLAGGRRRPRRVIYPSSARIGGVRFALHGRTSTAEFQDRRSRGAWQREIASALVAGQGTITVEFFDVADRGGWRGSGVRRRLRCWSGRVHRIGRLMRFWWASSSGRSPTASSDMSQTCWRSRGSRCGCRRRCAMPVHGGS